MLDANAPCGHVAALERPADPRAAGCETCLRTGGRWVHLRECLACGHVGCCDSSPGQHATAHYHTSGHAVIGSLEPGETWGWCYADRVAFDLGYEPRSRLA
jgi:uncharacterized UBP type Zn finger protein